MMVVYITEYNIPVVVPGLCMNTLAYNLTQIHVHVGAHKHTHTYNVGSHKYTQTHSIHKHTHNHTEAHTM